MALLQVGDQVPEVSFFKADRTEIPLTSFKGREEPDCRVLSARLHRRLRERNEEV